MAWMVWSGPGLGLSAQPGLEEKDYATKVTEKEAGGINLYGFVANTPLNAVDPNDNYRPTQDGGHTVNQR